MLRIAAAWISLFALLALTPASWAQSFSFTTSRSMGGATGTPVASNHVERYEQVLGLTDDQRVVVDDLFDSFQREYQAAVVERDEKMGDLRAEAQESGDFSIFMEDMPEITEAYREEVDRLRDRFFDDLRLVLTPDQERRWPDLERTRRRVETIGNGSLSGESVDLIQIVDDLEVPQAIASDLSPTLEQYETEIDRALEKRNALQRSEGLSIESGEIDVEAMEESMAEVQQASEEVRGVNTRFARQIKGSLPTELAEAFERAVRRASFPMVYRETYTQQALNTSMDFADLTDEQRERLAEMSDQYERELRAMNDRWAEAIADNEGNQNTMVMTAPNGSPMRVQMGEDSEELEDIRRDRRELNRDMLSKVRGLLSTEQRARLPEREERRLPAGGGASRVMVMEFSSSDDDGDGESDTEDVEVRRR